MKNLAELTVDAVTEGLLWQALPKGSIVFRREMTEVEASILTQIAHNRLHPSFDMTSDFKYVEIDLGCVMYDCLAEQHSAGFFDTDDLPPPELWVNFFDGKLIAVVPPAFEAIVALVIEDYSMSSSIIWVD